MPTRLMRPWRSGFCSSCWGDNPMIGRQFGDLPRTDAESAVTLRTRPGNPRQVVVQGAAASGADWQRDAALAVNGYRRYSTLRFRDGKLVYKAIARSLRLMPQTTILET